MLDVPHSIMYSVDVFQKSKHPCTLDESSLSIGRVKDITVIYLICDNLCKSFFNAMCV